jgi:hypothetical protein
MRRHAHLVLLTGLLLLACVRGAPAQGLQPLQPLPQLAACRTTAHPQLPQRWQGTYLMAPFTTGQLVLATIVHDGAAGATRIRLYGIKRGMADFLVTGETTYALRTDGDAVTDCRDLGDTGWRPLPPDWLIGASRCTGSAPILGTPVDWWKTPVDPAPSTYWIWYKRSDGTPFRLVFQAASDRLAPLSRFAMSYQLELRPLARTGLAEIAAHCTRAPTSSAGRGPAALAARLAAIDRSPERADAALARLVPGLQADCPVPMQLRWPERLAITGILTPFDASEDPVSTEILYDWTVPGQRTRIFPGPPTGLKAQDALLLADRGYTVAHPGAGGPSCAPGLPGTLRPNWAARAPCTCEALIAPGTPLTPDEAVRIFSCPLALPRIAWASYGLSGRPSMFMVTARQQDAGAGDFAVLDYTGWRPQHQLPRSAFTKPLQCTVPRQAAADANPPPRCSTCHLASQRIRSIFRSPHSSSPGLTLGSGAASHRWPGPARP